MASTFANIWNAGEQAGSVGGPVQRSTKVEQCMLFSSRNSFHFRVLIYVGGGINSRLSIEFPFHYLFGKIFSVIAIIYISGR